LEAGKITPNEFKNLVENKLNIPLTDKFKKIINSEDENFTKIVRVSLVS